jgi:hypothetical protein
MNIVLRYHHEEMTSWVWFMATMGHCFAMIWKDVAIDNHRRTAPCRPETKGLQVVDSTFEQCTMREDVDEVEGSTIDLIGTSKSAVRARNLSCRRRRRKDTAPMGSVEGSTEEGEGLMEGVGMLTVMDGLSMVEVGSWKDEVGTLTEGAAMEDGPLEKEEGVPKEEDNFSMIMRAKAGA